MQKLENEGSLSGNRRKRISPHELILAYSGGQKARVALARCVVLFRTSSPFCLTFSLQRFVQSRKILADRRRSERFGCCFWPSRLHSGFGRAARSGSLRRSDYASRQAMSVRVHSCYDSGRRERSCNNARARENHYRQHRYREDCNPISR